MRKIFTENLLGAGHNSKLSLKPYDIGVILIILLPGVSQGQSTFGQIPVQNGSLTRLTSSCRLLAGSPLGDQGFGMGLGGGWTPLFLSLTE